MDILKNKIKKYQKILAAYIQDLAYEYNTSIGNDVTYQAIIDTKANHFQLVRMGWRQNKSLYAVLIHLDINAETGNIWVQQNNTEILLDKDLEIKGIPQKHFVLGFRLVQMRAFSDYAIA